MSRFVFCLGFLLVCACYALDESADEETTEAVVKAVVEAEHLTGGDTSNEAVKDEEAIAAMTAATEVLKSEGAAYELVSSDVVEQAQDSAIETFEELSDAGVDTATAAVAAAKVAAATVDGASDLGLSSDAKDNAEKAAVAAATGVADHPESETAAVQEAVATVEQEEKTPGKVSLNSEPESVIGTAEDAITGLPVLAEDVAANGMHAVKHLGSIIPVVLMFACIIGFGTYKLYMNQYYTSPYVQNLIAIKGEFNRPSQEGVRDVESQYTGFRDHNEMSMR